MGTLVSFQSVSHVPGFQLKSICTEIRLILALNLDSVAKSTEARLFTSRNWSHWNTSYLFSDHKIHYIFDGGIG